MKQVKKFSLRAIRKSAHVGTKVLHKALSLSTKVEGKASRILNGTDYSVMLNRHEPLEKLLYGNIPYITPINPALPTLNQPPAVVLLIPTLDGKSFYGGTATALVVAAKVAVELGRPLRIVQTLKTGTPKDLDLFFKREGVSIDLSSISVMSVADRAYNLYGYLPMHQEDVFVASAWWDAHLINNLPLKYKYIYLVQDFEPIFYNNGDLYALAEQTYRESKYVPLCNTQLMYQFMEEKGYAPFKSSQHWFEPAVSRAKSGLNTTARNKKRLFLYGRPDVHRNMFFTSLMAIDSALKQEILNPRDWEIFMAGQDDLPDIKLGAGNVIENLGKMSMEEYTEFSKTVDIAVTPMMAPHPNYPTLEFSSIGTKVITTLYANKKDLSNYSPHIIMCDPEPVSMCEAISKAAKQLDASQSSASLKHSTLPENWNESLDKSISSCLKEIGLKSK